MLYWASCTLQTNTLEQRETERHSGKKKIKIKGKKQKYHQGGSVFFKQDKKIPEREENPGGFVVLCALCGKYQGLYIYINIVFINRINIFVPPQSFLD